MTKRITLTAREIEALLTTSGNVDAEATFEDANHTEAQVERLVEAWDSGRQKLAAMLATRQRRRRTAR